MKPPARKSARKKLQRDYAGLNSGQELDPNRWLRMMEGKTIKQDPFKRMKGSDVGIEWLENDENAMKEPILIEEETGLSMKMPPQEFTVDDVAEALGHEHPVEVIGESDFKLYVLRAYCLPFSRNADVTVQMSQPNRTFLIGTSGNGPNTGTRSLPSAIRSGTSFRLRYLGVNWQIRCCLHGLFANSTG